MQKMYKIIVVSLLLLGTVSVFAQEPSPTKDITPESPKEYIHAKVIAEYETDYSDTVYSMLLDNGGVIEHDTHGEILPIGTKVILEYFPDQGVYYFVSVQRTLPIFVLVLMFIGAILWLAGKKGIRSLVSLVLSFMLLFFGYIPLLLKGYDPLWTTLVFGLAVLVLSIFVTHGYNKQSLTSFIGSGLSIVCAVVLLLLVSHGAVISGLIGDQIQQLSYQVNDIINLSRLVSAGIIIGILGVLDDITITQVAVVRELSSDQTLSKKAIFRKALRVGRDHVSSLVNTLVFAYVGATLPMMMFISLLDIPFLVLISQEFIFVEIMRSLVGALALIVAVPVTTWLAAFVFLKGIHHDTDSIESACAHHHH
jgi:uncharacterized membrane protein